MEGWGGVREGRGWVREGDTDADGGDEGGGVSVFVGEGQGVLVWAVTRQLGGV